MKEQKSDEDLSRLEEERGEELEKMEDIPGHSGPEDDRPEDDRPEDEAPRGPRATDPFRSGG